VYRARHEVIDKLVAIKILLPTEDGDVVGRFVNEAKAATAIGNAHIVDTVDFGALPDGSTYFVMEYLEGRTLSKTIKAEQFIPTARALNVAHQIAEAMSAAHRAGIVHRDLKPENIFLTHRDHQEDFVKLLDFGIAKMQHAQNKITRAGTIFGTPHYMSPEQAAGAEVDPRTDVYSLGVILYEMVSGKVPFDAENPMGLLTQHMYTEPVPLTRFESPPQPLSAALDAVVLRCLAKKAADRYATMSDLAEDLTRVERGEPPAALADLLARAERTEDHALLEAAQQELRARRSGGWKAWAATLAAGVLVAGATASIYSQRGSTETMRHEAVAPTSAPFVTAIASPSAAAPSTTPVALVFSPIDGEVFRNGQSLGGMPVTIQLAAGEVADVEIRREGFFPEKLKVDGSRPVIIARLNPIPGVQPAVPVPTGEPLEELRRSSSRMATWLLNHREAVATLRADAGIRRPPTILAPPAPTATPAPAPNDTSTQAPAPPQPVETAPPNPAVSAGPPLDLPAAPVVSPPPGSH
jgi:serine/threonine-protein kinase